MQASKQSGCVYRDIHTKQNNKEDLMVLLSKLQYVQIISRQFILPPLTHRYITWYYCLFVCMMCKSMCTIFTTTENIPQAF